MSLTDLELCPDSRDANDLDKGFENALALFQQAATRVPAYKQFLKDAGVDPALVRSKSDFAQVPPVDKVNYFSRFNLAELSWDGRLSPAKYISMSSGSTGNPSFWPRGAQQDVGTGSLYRRFYEGVFDTKNGTTLFVNTFHLGIWMAGLEVYGSTQWASGFGNSILTAAPGPDKGEVIKEVKALSPYVDRIILAGVPPFMKDILHLGRDSGIDWEKLDVRLMVAGEAITESWRDRMLQLIGRPGDLRKVMNVYGMTESGTVAHETPSSVALRRAFLERPPEGRVQGSEVTGVYQFYPTLRYFETGPENALYLTSPAGLPLIRYSTRDEGGVLGFDEARALAGPSLDGIAKQIGASLEGWSLPFVYLYGRRDLSLSFYSFMIYVEQIKGALEGLMFDKELSGLFTMTSSHDDDLEPKLEVTVEMAASREPNDELSSKVRTQIVQHLRRVSPEYAKAYTILGEKAAPVIKVLKQGQLATQPGKKHKWVKR